MGEVQGFCYCFHSSRCLGSFSLDLWQFDIIRSTYVLANLVPLLVVNIVGLIVVAMW